MEDLFLYCNFAYHLWRSSPWGVYPILNFGGQAWDWVKFLWNLKASGVDSDKLFLYASVIVDTIWRTRNDQVHNSKSNNILTAIDSISHCYTNYVACLFPPMLHVAPPAWTPPPEDWIKINCDARVGGNSMCIATLARNHSGNILWAVVSRLGFRDPLIGEAAACCLALDSTRFRGHNFVLVENDSEMVINALKDGLSIGAFQVLWILP
uniref:RNase H type-1 domain-containing protein n=1 Tax=Cannabis sativa TaxID=3483 RepID=A0A803Q6S8_CANSA